MAKKRNHKPIKEVVSLLRSGLPVPHTYSPLEYTQVKEYLSRLEPPIEVELMTESGETFIIPVKA